MEILGVSRNEEACMEMKMQKSEGLYVVPSETGGAVNLVVGSKTFRLAEFNNFDEAIDFALEFRKTLKPWFS